MFQTWWSSVSVERRRRLVELARMTAGERVRSVFHPIVRLVDRLVSGHEALTRPIIA